MSKVYVTSKERLSLVVEVDIWAQENDSELDNEFSKLMKMTHSDWSSWDLVQKNDYKVFEMAFNLANQHKERAGL